MSTVQSREITEDRPKTNSELYSENPIISTNQFSINYLKYPLKMDEDSGVGGLGKEFKNWISFNINVRGKSRIRLPNENVVGQIFRSPDAPQLNEDQLGVASQGGLILGGAVGGAAAANLATSFARKFSTKNQATGADTIGIVASILGGAVGGAAAAFVSQTEILKPDTTFRISDAICLYVSEPPSVRYASQYNNRDLGTLAGLIGTGVNSVMSGSASDTLASEGAAAVAAKFAQIPQMFGASTADVLGASARVALNPFKEVLFEAVDFRSFVFKYKFMPKNKKESEEVYRIIEKFKFHMHPELSANKLFFIYPSEFQITYHFGDRENNKDNNGYYHKFKPCVLETMDVSYGGDQFSSFVDGNPTEVNLSLTFRETEILTKQQIAQGY